MPNLNTESAARKEKRKLEKKEYNKKPIKNIQISIIQPFAKATGSHRLEKKIQEKKIEILRVLVKQEKAFSQRVITEDKEAKENSDSLLKNGIQGSTKKELDRRSTHLDAELKGINILNFARREEETSNQYHQRFTENINNLNDKEIAKRIEAIDVSYGIDIDGDKIDGINQYLSNLIEDQNLLKSENKWQKGVIGAMGIDSLGDCLGFECVGKATAEAPITIPGIAAGLETEIAAGNEQREALKNNARKNRRSCFKARLELRGLIPSSARTNTEGSEQEQPMLQKQTEGLTINITGNGNTVQIGKSDLTEQNQFQNLDSISSPRVSTEKQPSTKTINKPALKLRRNNTM